MSITPKLPLNFDNLNLYESTEDIIEITRFHVKNIVLTNPGEKISDPNFGVGIRRYLFENMTGSTNSSIRGRVYGQLSRYTPHIEILSLEVQPSEEDNLLVFNLSYYISYQCRKPMDLE